MTKMIALVVAASLTGCATTHAPWVERKEGELRYIASYGLCQRQRTDVVTTHTPIPGGMTATQRGALWTGLILGATSASLAVGCFRGESSCQLPGPDGEMMSPTTAGVTFAALGTGILLGGLYSAGVFSSAVPENTRTQVVVVDLGTTDCGLSKIDPRTLPPWEPVHLGAR